MWMLLDFSNSTYSLLKHLWSYNSDLLVCSLYNWDTCFVLQLNWQVHINGNTLRAHLFWTFREENKYIRHEAPAVGNEEIIANQCPNTSQINWNTKKYSYSHYHPRTKFGAGNVFTAVCDSVHSGDLVFLVPCIFHEGGSLVPGPFWAGWLGIPVTRSGPIWGWGEFAWY